MPQNLTRRAFLARLAKVAGVAVAAPAMVKAAGTPITWQVPDVVADRYRVLGRSGDYFYKVTPYRRAEAFDGCEFSWKPWSGPPVLAANRQTMLAYQKLLEVDRDVRYRLNADLFR